MVNKVQVKLSWVFEREDLFCPRAEENALKSNWILDYITYMTLYTYLYYLKEYFEMYIQYIQPYKMPFFLNNCLLRECDYVSFYIFLWRWRSWRVAPFKQETLQTNLSSTKWNKAYKHEIATIKSCNTRMPTLKFEVLTKGKKYFNEVTILCLVTWQSKLLRLCLRFSWIGLIDESEMYLKPETVFLYFCLFPGNGFNFPNIKSTSSSQYTNLILIEKIYRSISRERMSL